MTLEPTTNDVRQSFAEATDLLAQARQRLDALAEGGRAAVDAANDARRVNSGLLQVLSVLNSVAELSQKNQTLLNRLLLEVEQGRDRGVVDNVAPAELPRDIVDRLDRMVTRGDLEALMAKVDGRESPAWLPELHRFITGTVSLAIAEAMPGSPDMGEELSKIRTSLLQLETRVQADLSQGSPTPGDDPDALAALLSGQRDVVAHLKSLEKATNKGLKREEPVQEASAAVAEALDRLSASAASMSAAMTKLVTKQNALEKRLSAIDDVLTELARDMEDVYAALYEVEEPPPRTGGAVRTVVAKRTGS